MSAARSCTYVITDESRTRKPRLIPPPLRRLVNTARESVLVNVVLALIQAFSRGLVSRTETVVGFRAQPNKPVSTPLDLEQAGCSFIEGLRATQHASVAVHGSPARRVWTYSPRDHRSTRPEAIWNGAGSNARGDLHVRDGRCCRRPTRYRRSPCPISQYW